jgi:hypothetical protein
MALGRTSVGLARLRPRPLVGFGGRAFNLNPGLRLPPPATFLGEDAAQGASAALRLLRPKG